MTRVFRNWESNSIILGLLLAVVLSATEIKSQDMKSMKMPSQQKPQPSQSPSPTPKPSPGQMPNMPGMSLPQASPSPSRQTQMNMPEMEGDSMNADSPLVMSGDKMAIRVGPRDQNVMFIGAMASGTSEQPSSSPMHMVHMGHGKWLFMLHYNLIVGLNRQGGPRGATKFESANWFMPIAFHRFGPGTLQLRGMFSAEPFTFARGGSPLLFQTGETYKGQPLIDRQHPHDLFMELSARYTVPLGEQTTWFAYVGYPGEPGLGPPAFMHRISASENPSAPLAHHLQDSTHISFGVFTTGVTYRWLQLEGSIFNGREPDENRYNFEAHPWNSRSARLSFAPNANWSMQISHGLLQNPEALEPGTTRRTTASISYNKEIMRGNWATSLIWGRNHENHGPREIFNLNGYAAESTVNFFDRNYVFMRLELVDKIDLLRLADRLRLGISQSHPSFRIGAYTFGGVRDVWNTAKVSLGIGSDITFYSKPATLDSIYGNNPVSWRLFVRLRPAKMKMDKQAMHDVHK
jgi:hypothetical protein